MREGLRKGEGKWEKKEEKWKIENQRSKIGKRLKGKLSILKEAQFLTNLFLDNLLVQILN